MTATSDNGAMASLLLITGPPGAGKSAVARLIVERFEPSVLVAGDEFFAFLARGALPPWLPEARAQNTVVTRAAASAAGRFVTGGYILLPSLERCAARVARRQGHGFTDQAATQHMHEQFAGATIGRRHLLVDPPDEVEAVAEQIVEAVAGGTLLYESPS